MADMPGPANYSPKPVLAASKKVSIRLPAPTVYIELTPGVGSYDVKPVMKREPTMKMQTAPKKPVFEREEQKHMPGPANYQTKNTI